MSEQETRKPAPHVVGEAITFHDQWQLSGKNSGRILHVIWATKEHELTYVVSPDVSINGQPRSVAASEVIE